MKQARMRPTTRSYNALLSACERAGQPERALEVWANMQRARRNGDAQLQPTAVTYNTLLSTCGKAGWCAAHTSDRLARQHAKYCVARKLMSWSPP
jgi:pentatricopeptide repeat protein